jgi:hypothetical protein
MLAARSLRGDGLQTGRGLDLHTDVRRAMIRHDRAFPYQLDGDYLGEVHEIELLWEADVLRLVVPEGRRVPRPPEIL